MPPKRRASAAERVTEELKKARSVIDETAEELLCAITMALPVDQRAARTFGRRPTVLSRPAMALQPYSPVSVNKSATRTFGRRPTALTRPATALQPYSPRDCVRGLVRVRVTRGYVTTAVHALAVDRRPA